MNKIAEKMKAEMIAEHGEEVINDAFERIEAVGGKGAFEWIVCVSEAYKRVMQVPIQHQISGIPPDEALFFREVLPRILANNDPGAAAFAHACIFILKFNHIKVQMKLGLTEEECQTIKANIVYN